MNSRGLQYWLDWPHSRGGWVVAAALFVAATVVAVAADLFYASLAGVIISVRFGWKALTWEDETDGGASLAGESGADGSVVDDRME